MPWETTTRMTQRELFINDYLNQHDTALGRIRQDRRKRESVHHVPGIKVHHVPGSTFPSPLRGRQPFVISEAIP